MLRAKEDADHMKTLRTPDDRFVGLPEFDVGPHYASVDDLDGGQLRVHFLDEGPREADPVLLFRGDPSWCYLYRKMVPVLVAAGHRVVVPDLVGFGRSDKPADRGDYSYARHVAWMRELSDSDPITRGGDALFQQLIPGATGQAHTTISDGGHFLQEDKGEDLAAVIVDFIAANPIPTTTGAHP